MREYIDDIQDFSRVELNSVLKYMEDEDPYIQWAAESTIEALDQRLLETYLIENLESPLVYKRIASIKILAKFNNAKDYSKYFLKLLNDSDTRVQQQAAIALGKLVENNYSGLIDTMFSDEDKSLRQGLLEVFNNVFHGKSEEAIAFLLNNDNKEIKKKARKVIKQVIEPKKKVKARKRTKRKTTKAKKSKRKK